MEFRLQRDNDVDVVFEGKRLAYVSSQTPETPRWTEIAIYKTDSGRYVVEQVGESSFPEEVRRTSVKVVDDPKEIARVLRRKDRVEYLTRLALDALDEAAANDPNVAATLPERI